MAAWNPDSDFIDNLSPARLFIRDLANDRTAFVFGGNRKLSTIGMNFEAMALALSCVGTFCWALCFWWMYRISSRQDALLEELHEVTKRIEKLSKAEHDLISDVHPQVNEIKEHVENVREVVSPEKR